MSQQPVGIASGVPSYVKTTHPKPHKKMIIDKYIPTIEAAQKVAEEALIIHVEKSASVKQYKGKRDPSNTRPTMQPMLIVPLSSLTEPQNGQIIDLSKSSTNHTPGSTKTVCSDGAIELSTCHTENSETDEQSDAPWDPSKPDRQRHLVRSAIETFERNVPCMTTLERVMSWRVSAELDEVEEFSSGPTEKLEPFRLYLENYDAVSRQILSKLNCQVQPHYSTAVCNDSATLLRVDYSKKLNGNKADTNRVSPPNIPNAGPDERAFKVSAPIVIDSNSDEVEDGCGEYSGSSESQKEELYKYLGIDTNPLHARDAALAKETTNDELEARCKRRSLRVKVQQIAINNLAKYHREKESIERIRREEYNLPSMLNEEPDKYQRKTLLSDTKAKKLNGLNNSEKTSNPHRLLLPIAKTPKDRRLTTAAGVTSSTSATSSQNSDKFSERNGADVQYAQKKPVINVRGRGRPRKLIEHLPKLSKSKSISDVEVETALKNHADNVVIPLSKRRHSDQNMLNTEVPTVKHKQTNVHNGSMRSTSSASPYPQTTSSNDLGRPRSEKNFTSDEKGSNKSSPLILKRFNQCIPPPAKKASLLERRDYSKPVQPTPDLQTSTKSPIMSYSASYSAKVLMKTRKLNEETTLADVSAQNAFDPTSPISERLQLRQLQRLAELENSSHLLKSPSTKKKATISRRQVPKVVSQRQKPSQNMNKKSINSKPNEGESNASDNHAVPSDITHDSNVDISPYNRLGANATERLSSIEQPHKCDADSEHTDLAKPLPPKAAPIRQRRPAVSPRIRRLTNMRITMRNHRPRRSASIRRPISHANGITPTTSAANIGRRSNNKVQQSKANIFKRREPVDKDSVDTALSVAMDESDTQLNDSPKRSVSSASDVFLGFDLSESHISIDTSDELSDNGEIITQSNMSQQSTTPSEGRAEVCQDVPEIIKPIAAYVMADNQINELVVSEIQERTSTPKESATLDSFDISTPESPAIQYIESIEKFQKPAISESTKMFLEPDITSPMFESIEVFQEPTITSPISESITTFQEPAITSPISQSTEMCSMIDDTVETLPDTPIIQHLESTGTSVKSSRSTSHRSSRPSVDSDISNSNPKIINDLVSAAVAEIIGVAPVVCTKPISRDRKTSTCVPIINANPLRSSSGAVLAVVKAKANGNSIAVVQEREVSFWHQPSQLFDIFGVRQQWTCQASITRRTEDTEVQSNYQNRVLSHNGQLVYIECRAKQFEPSKTRECYICAVYLNVYVIDQQTGEARMHIVDLDKILGLASSIRYIIISGPKNGVVVSWTEMSAQRTRCGFCKYSLSSTLDMLEEVNQYPIVEQPVMSISCFDEDKLLILGESSVMLWNYRTGDMLLNLDIDHLLGVSVGGFIANDGSNRFMFLIQLVPTENHAQRLELLAINLSDNFSIKVVQSHDIPDDFAELSTSCVTSTNQITATFTSGHSLLMSLGNPRRIHLRKPNRTECSPSSSGPQNEEHPSSQSFVLHDQIVQIFEDRMSISTVWDHFHGDARN